MSDIKAFLFDDDRGVSPVIGVILMVAITVILAAVIAAFVLGLGDTNSTAPNVNFEYDYQADASPPVVEVTMTGGESFDPARVTFTGDNLNLGNGGGDLSNADDTWDDSSASPGNTVTAGDSITLELASSNTDQFELDIIFTSEDGGTSSEIGGTSGPEA